MTNMRWFIYADTAIINVDRLLAMTPTTLDGHITLLFDCGQTLIVSADVAKLIVDALRQWEQSDSTNGLSCVPQCM